VSVTFLQPEGTRLLVRRGAGELGHLTARMWTPSSPAAADSVSGLAGVAGVDVAAGTVLEVAIPLAGLRCAPGAPVAFFVAVLDPQDHEIERHPPFRPIETAVPDVWFEASNWNA